MSFIAQSFTAAMMFSPAVLAPVVSRQIGFPATMVGVVTALIYFSAAISAPAAGGYVARLGAVRMTQFCLLLSGGGLALTTWGHPAAVVFGALLIGMGYGPSTPAGSVLLSHHSPERFRNIVMSVRQTGVTLGGALVGIILPWLMNFVHWQSAVWICAGFGLLVAVAMEPLRKRLDQPLKEAAHRSSNLIETLSLLKKEPALLKISILAFVYGGVQLTFTSFLVVFLLSRTPLTVIQAGALMSVSMLSGLISRLLWGAVADYCRNAKVVLMVLGLSMMVCALLMTQVTAQWSFLSLCVLTACFGASCLGWNGVYVGEISRIAPTGQVAVWVGGSLFFAYMGAMVMQSLVVAVHQYSGGYNVVFLMIALLGLTGSVCAGQSLREDRLKP